MARGRENAHEERILCEALERARRQRMWQETVCKRDKRIDPCWFLRVQRNALANGRTVAAVRVLLGEVRTVAREWCRPSAARDGVAALRQAVDRAVSLKCAKGCRDPSMARRLTAAANFAWCTVHGWVPHPLPRPPPVRVAATSSTNVPRVFTNDEVDSLIAAADASGDPRRAILVRFLAYTGVRIGALPALRWQDVLDPDGTVRDTVRVREKGGVQRVLLLPTDLKCVLQRHAVTDHREQRVLAHGVRHLRRLFQRDCDAVGLADGHPHAMRHALAHRLFALGNPIALIAKFLGHRSLNTTNDFYLRLTYEEVAARMTLPWV